MFIPLGFGKKVPGMSWASYLLMAFVVVYSIQGFRKLRTIDNDRLKSSEYLSFKDNLKAWVASDCAKNLGPSQCRYVIASIENSKSRLPKDHVLSKDLNPTEIKKAQEYISSALLSDGETDTKEYRNYIQAKDNLKIYTANKMQEAGILTSNQFSIASAFRSHFLHANWSHLIGNLLVFWFFARLLEARVGSLLLLFIFMAGGVLGTCMQSFLTTPSTSVLGASAGVSAIIGSFYVCFFKRNVRVLLLNPMTWFSRHEMKVPVNWSIPIAYVILDVAGTLNPGLMGTTVGYWAHISGFVFGLLGAYLYEKASPHLANVLFEREEKLLVEFSQRGKIENLIEVLSINPDSILAMKYSIRYFLARRDFANPHFKMALTNFWACQFKSRDWKSLLKILNQIPPEVSLRETVPKIGQQTLLGTGQAALKVGDWQCGLRAFGLFAEKYAGQQTFQATYETLKGLIHVGCETQEGEAWLKIWYGSLRNFRLKELLVKDFRELFGGPSHGKHSA